MRKSTYANIVESIVTLNWFRLKLNLIFLFYKIILPFYGSPNKCIKELKKIDKTRWAAIACTLNRWDFPPELKFKPSWWDSASMDLKSAFISPIREAIESVIPQKEINWEWNKERMTKEEHEYWWYKERCKYFA